MKYPFLLAALLLCSANLAARHPDTHTLLQPDTLSLSSSPVIRRFSDRENVPTSPVRTISPSCHRAYCRLWAPPYWAA